MKIGPKKAHKQKSLWYEKPPKSLTYGNTDMSGVGMSL